MPWKSPGITVKLIQGDPKEDTRTVTGNVSGATGAVEELPTHESLALLRESPVGRLAVVVEGRPDIFPVNHVVDHGTVVFRTARGSKFWGAAGLPVAFEVDGYDVVERTRMERGRTREGGGSHPHR